jgi:hypothetical protein
MNEFLERKTRDVFMALCAMICVTRSMSRANVADGPNILLFVADDVFWLGIQK